LFLRSSPHSRFTFVDTYRDAIAWHRKGMLKP
jgi:hypothetical protein